MASLLQIFPWFRESATNSGVTKKGPGSEDRARPAEAFLTGIRR